eukprot:scaffold107557_cov15-Prasinocladus_malaysianus.AAC.1
MANHEVSADCATKMKLRERRIDIYVLLIGSMVQAEEPDSELAYKAVLKVTALCTNADSPGIQICRA